MEPPPLEAYFEVIHSAFESLPISYSAELWCEPGRALCAEYASVLVRVEKRRGDELYINDGAYGALFDAAHIGWRFPVQLRPRDAVRRARHGVQLLRADLRRSRPYGGAVPCCPPTSQAGDYVEIGMLGAYGCAMRTGFNGFGSDLKVIADDEPMATLYGGRRGTRGRRRTSSRCNGRSCCTVIPAKAGISAPMP